MRYQKQNSLITINNGLETLETNLEGGLPVEDGGS